MSNQTIIIKIGSSSLTKQSGEVSVDKLRQVVKHVSFLKRMGHKPVIVSSGAIACGFRLLKLSGRPQSIREKQAAAAVGQGILIQHYRELFQESGLEMAQVLLNRSDFSHRKRYMNALNTLELLLERDFIPVINENDSIAVEEIRWGDNDFLAAQVAGLLQAEWLVLVTSADGVYTRDPALHPEAEAIPYFSAVSEELLSRMDLTHSKFGTGGMRSKLEAASHATGFGTNVYVGKAKPDEAWLQTVLDGEGTGTYIGTKELPPSRKRQWIGYHSQISGYVTIDEGAERALEREHRSLLPCGVLSVDGEFVAGDVVEVVNTNGTVLGRGVVNYSSHLLDQAKGLQTQDIQAKWVGCLQR
ncbi:glutamate 5-kinase [Novibacillus thermophilus]|uniref:glutamate 5-kinase n=1 Tax=Novibacillus thermophilus TaxID=1471761 RepID=UPI0014742F29|nr:glutamate 5-kinase [Novibacillus thermophilus]